MKKHHALIFLTLLLASVQCVRVIFYENVSYVSLEDYENGRAKLPFQDRVLMQPLLRWAHMNPTLVAVAARTNAIRKSGTRGPQTPEELATSMLGILSVVGLGILATAEAIRRRMQLVWLPWTLLLVILYVSYAARATQNYWYPWDLPGCFLFGAGTYFIMRRWWFALLLLMPLVTANRETAIFLAFLWVVAAWRREHGARTLAQTGLLVLAWATVRVLITRHYAVNPSETGGRLSQNMAMLHDPRSWPQILSAFGYLMPFLLLYRDRLSLGSRRLLWGMMPCVMVILWYGVWIESRIVVEFSFLCALLASEAWENRPEEAGKASLQEEAELVDVVRAA